MQENSINVNPDAGGWREQKSSHGELSEDELNHLIRHSRETIEYEHSGAENLVVTSSVSEGREPIYIVYKDLKTSLDKVKVYDNLNDAVNYAKQY